jgi:hypothetical protein
MRSLNNPLGWKNDFETSEEISASSASVLTTRRLYE